MSGDDHHNDPHGYGHDEPQACVQVGIIFICVVVALTILSLL
ncbi:MAG: hypothetical protein OEY01_04705 [Desulfobulbaceae bacterium]|nr:hypothetical protein [Desulfobulbaceae bacterium]